MSVRWFLRYTYGWATDLEWEGLIIYGLFRNVTINRRRFIHFYLRKTLQLITWNMSEFFENSLYLWNVGKIYYEYIQWMFQATAIICNCTTTKLKIIETVVKNRVKNHERNQKIACPTSASLERNLDGAILKQFITIFVYKFWLKSIETLKYLLLS